jgi:putative peptidoglycan lipid II flippase
MPKMDKDVKLLLKRMVPGIIGGGVTQINLWINTVIATTMAGAVSYLYYADRLVQFPLSIIGTAMGTALLPTLSKQIIGKKFKEAVETQNNALEMVMISTIPAAVALFIIAEPLISVMFERGKFTSYETHATATALMAYSFGLPAFVMVKIFVPGFFANGDTKTPVIIAGMCLLLNVTLSLILIRLMGHTGLAIATSVSAWLNTGLLCAILIKRRLYYADKSLNKRLIKVVISSLLMGVLLYYMQQGLAQYLRADFTMKSMAVLALIITGMASYILIANLTGATKVADIRRLLKK